jgi:hypothetical protein
MMPKDMKRPFLLLSKAITKVLPSPSDKAANSKYGNKFSIEGYAEITIRKIQERKSVLIVDNYHRLPVVTYNFF